MCMKAVLLLSGAFFNFHAITSTSEKKKDVLMVKDCTH